MAFVISKSKLLAKGSSVQQIPGAEGSPMIESLGLQKSGPAKKPGQTTLNSFYMHTFKYLVGQTNASFEIFWQDPLPLWIAERIPRVSEDPIILVILLITPKLD